MYFIQLIGVFCVTFKRMVNGLNGDLKLCGLQAKIGRMINAVDCALICFKTGLIAYVTKSSGVNILSFH